MIRGTFRARGSFDAAWSALKPALAPDEPAAGAVVLPGLDGRGHGALPAGREQDAPALERIAGRHPGSF